MTTSSTTKSAPDKAGATPLSSQENKADRIRRLLGTWLALPILLIALLVPTSLATEQQNLLAVLGLVILLWLTEALPIPVTALLGISLLVVLGVAPAAEIFGAFGSTTIFLVIGAFMIARAMTVHGLDRRFALSVLSLPGVGHSTYRTALAFGAVALAISGFISSSATAAMLLPIGIGIAGTVGKIIQEAHPEKTVSELRFSCLIMLSIAYGASVGGLLTPVSGPANLIGRGLIEQQTGTTINFVDWMIISVPYIAIMGFIMAVIVCLLNRPEVRHIPNGQEIFQEQLKSLGRMSFAEKAVISIFGTVVVLWIAPSLVDFLSSPPAWMINLSDHLNEGAIPVIGAALLFCIPARRGGRQPVLSWPDAVKIDWGTVLLVGAGLTFGSMMTQTELATTLGNGLADVTGVSTTFALTTLAVVFGLVVSETVSNTASVGILLPIIIPIATAANIDPVVPAMAGIIAASSGAMLPISTPPNAIVYGSGMVPISRMVRTGVICDLISIVLIIGLAMSIMLFVFN
ncbi:SLC13 family permease [Corynebacterium sp. AOP40-9SA-29]|uniref:SLC13 family permease n=1 Tax=Corynebacterium sp. AOP40-9SA-29 TaxID=3457677 RepID=UPI00403462ED